MKKSTFYKLLLLLQAFGCCNWLHSQHITLKDKQFYDQSGQPFYPITCNYAMELTCNNCDGIISTEGYCTACDLSDFEIHPGCGYGSSGLYDEPFDKGVDKIRADLTKIKSLGFNTVRVLFFGALFKMDKFRLEEDHPWDYYEHFRLNLYSPQGGGKMMCKYYSNPNCINCPGYEDWWGYGIKILPPYGTIAPYAADDNLHNIYMPKMNEFLDIANDVGINVIIVTGEQFISYSQGQFYEPDGMGGHTITTVPDARTQQAQDYADFLSELANMLKDREEILAFDLFNEPVFHMWDKTTASKAEICSFTSMWYDAVKAKDPNRLVTIGNVDLGDISFYDPAIMKIDFNSLHPYPFYYWAPYENYNMDNAINRMNIIYYWQNNNSTVPWMIGETGARAISSTWSDPSNKTVTFAEQTDYALRSQQGVLNYGGCGYSLWQFQDNEGHGLLTPGNPSLIGTDYVYTNALDRPFAADAFTDNVVTTKSGPAGMPEHYYNPFLGSSSNFTFSGRILDQDDNPIKDALITASNNWQHSAFIPSPQLFFGIFTFSNENGEFELHAPISGPADPQDYNYSSFDHILISALGSSVFWWDKPTTDLTDAVPVWPNGELKLNRTNSLLYNSVVDETIANTEHETFEGRFSLRLENDAVEAGGEADFHAGMEVLIPAGTAFRADEGSETFLHCETNGPNCAMGPSGKTTNKKGSTVSLIGNHFIDVNYVRDKESVMQLSPNPAKDLVYLLTTQVDSTLLIEIFDLTGALLHRGIAQDGQVNPIDVSYLTPGMYIVRVFGVEQKENFKLIIK